MMGAGQHGAKKSRGVYRRCPLIVHRTLPVLRAYPCICSSVVGVASIEVCSAAAATSKTRLDLVHEDAFVTLEDHIQQVSSRFRGSITNEAISGIGI